MKKLLIIACLTYSLHGHNFLADKTNFVTDENVITLLDTHINEVKDAFKSNIEGCIKKGKVYEFSWLPGYIIKKRAISRIRGTIKIRNTIEKYNLDLLVIPDKRLYHIPGQRKKLSNDNYLLVCPKYHDKEEQKPFTLDQVEQILTFLLGSGYGDFKPDNYFRLEDNKLVIIDTEWQVFNPNKKFKNIARLIFDTDLSLYTESAFILIMQSLSKYIPKNKYEDASNRYPYKRIYDLLKYKLEEESHQFTWDSLAFFNEHFPSTV